MLRNSCASAGTTRLVLALAVCATGALPLFFLATPASAAAVECNALQSMLLQRRSITEKLSAQTKNHKKMDARFACGEFGKLVTNGSTILKWAGANKDWCQIPDTFIAGVKADHNNAVSIKARACNVAAKQTQMEKQARQGGGQQQGGLLGGGGLQGQTKLPQGAL